MGWLDTSVMTITYIILGMTILAAGFLVWHVRRYKYFVRIREVVNGRRLITDDKAREVTVDNVKYWALLKRRERIPVPPDASIDLTSKGRKTVEVYRSQGGDLVYLKDVGDQTKPSDFEPLTTNQRLMLIEEIKKANLRKKNALWENLPQIVSISAFFLFLIVVVVFWSDLAKTILDVHNNQKEITDKQAIIMTDIRDIIQNRQTIPAREAPPR